MWLNELYQRWNGRRPRQPAARQRGLRLSLEQLDDRTVPSAATADAVLVNDFHPAGTAAVGDAGSSDLQRDLARARRATAKYHDLNAALADGFVDTGLPCIEGQGYHYINFSRIGTLDVEKPQLLVYAPGNHLVAVEWIIPASLVGDVPPTLFGQTFHGPTGGLFLLHAWVWRANPDGMFADTHPGIHCEDVAATALPKASTNAPSDGLRPASPNGGDASRTKTADPSVAALAHPQDSQCGCSPEVGPEWNPDLTAVWAIVSLR